MECVPSTADIDSELQARRARRVRATLRGTDATVRRDDLDRVAQLATDLLPHCDEAELVLVDGASIIRIRATAGLGDNGVHPRDASAVTDPERRQLVSALAPPGFGSAAWLPPRLPRGVGAAVLVYGRGPDVLGGAPPRTLDLVAGLTGSLISRAVMAEELDHVRVALDSNRRIGMAIGVIIERFHVDDEEAFEVLRDLSQHSHKKLRDVADDILLTGDITLHRELITARQRPVSETEPISMRRAVGYLEDHLTDHVTIDDVAVAAGVSPRTLQLAFRRYRKTTPLGYQRQRRLEQVHDELRRADPVTGATVADVARRWGFTHLGRFAGDYRSRYGCSPSHTLRT